MLNWQEILPLHPGSRSRRPAYQQLADQLIAGITSGRLAPGQKLPGSRQLAAMLSANRKTVVAAYAEAGAQGWLDSRPGGGTYVRRDLPTLRPHELHPVQRPRSAHQPNRGRAGEELPAGWLRLTEGSPDVRLAPLRRLYGRMRSLLTTTAGLQHLRYGPAQGNARLRQVLGEYLGATRGMFRTPDQLLITRGSQMALDLIIRTQLRPGDRVALGEPGYPAAALCLRQYGMDIVALPVDGRGLVPAALNAVPDVRAVYLTPHHHYPTTVTLAAERRLELLDLARRRDFFLIEDDYDYDFHYGSGPTLPLASADTEGKVFYIGSFTKCLAPGLRVGYVAGPAAAVGSMSEARRILDRQGDLLLEQALAEFLREGELQRHLRKSRRIYRQRRDAFAQLLIDCFGATVSFDVPEGGMAIWAIFDESVQLEKLQAAARRHHISLEDAERWWAGHRAIRFGFASLDEAEMERVRVAFGGLNH